jgi:hypothetical protein
MDVIDGVIGMMGSDMLQTPTRNQMLAAALRGQSFADLSGGAGYNAPQPPQPPQAMPQPAPQAAPAARLPLALAAAQASPPVAPQQAAQAMPQQQQPTSDLERNYQDLVRQQQENSAALQRALQPVDHSAAEAAYRAHADSGMTNTVMALLARQAGPSYAHMQDAFLRQAAEAQQPMKMAGGTMTPEGWVPDPDYAHALELRRLEAKDTALTRALETNLTLSERARLEGQRERNQKDIADAQMRMHLQTAQLIHAASGAAGAGTWGDAGTDPNTGAPVYQNNKTGLLMTHDAQGNPVRYQGAPTGKNAASEDERKGAGWLGQAENAKANVDRVVAEHPNAMKPGVVESVAGWLPGKWGDDLANSVRSGDRQKFVQAASSFSEAALRMATGAGVNRDEAIQKINELTPRFGDKPDVIKQKMESWDGYIAQFKARAGRAAPHPAAAGASAPNRVKWGEL